MAYIFEKGCFLHLPKGAGRYTKDVLENTWDVSLDGHRHDLPSEWDHPLMFTVLREPTEWLRSFWGHRNSGRWSKDVGNTFYTTLSHMVQPYANADFNKFAWDITANLPGLIGWFYGLYTPPPVTVVKLENLDTFLKELGADPDAVEPVGVREDLPEITQVTKNLVICAEVATYIRYKWSAKDV